MLSATGGCEGGVLQPGQAEAAAQKPPEGPHWSPALAIRGSGAWERAGAAGARLPRSSHRHSPGRPAGPAPPAHAWPRRPGPPCPAEATAQPLPRPPSHQPRAGSSPASNCPGSSSEESSDRSRAGCLRPAPPLPAGLPCGLVSVSTQAWDLPAQASVPELGASQRACHWHSLLPGAL